MAEWTDDAREYLDGYLRQVAALARRNGDDADEIVDGLREHVEHKATLGGAATVDVDLLIEVLHEVGSPSDVIEMDAAALARREPMAAPGRPAPAREARPKPQKQVIVQKSNTGRWIFATVLLLLFVVSIPFLLMAAAIVIPAFGPVVAPPNEVAERVEELAHEEAVNDALQAKCEENMVRIGEALKMYAADHGKFPWMFDEPNITRGFSVLDINLMPQYLEMEHTLYCPAELDLVDDGSNDFSGLDSYVYPHMATQSPLERDTFMTLYSETVRRSHHGVDMNGMEKYLFETVPEEDAGNTPLLIERPGHHTPNGGHVLYLDGHVEYIEMGEKYPMTESFFETLKSLDSALEIVRIKMKNELYRAGLE